MLSSGRGKQATLAAVMRVKRLPSRHLGLSMWVRRLANIPLHQRHQVSSLIMVESAGPGKLTTWAAMIRVGQGLRVHDIP